MRKKLDTNGQFMSTDSDISANIWQSHMRFSEVDKIQHSCHEAMAKWGYKIFKYEDVHPSRALLPIDIVS